MLEQALAHHKVGRLREAEDAYNRILGADPKNVDALHLLASLYQQTARTPLAIDTFSRAIALANQSEVKAVLLFNLAAAQRTADRGDDAIKSLAQAIELAPEYLNAHTALAEIYDGKKDLDAAAREYQAALAIDADDAGASVGLARTQITAGLVDHAIARLRDTLRQFRNPQVHSDLCLASNYSANLSGEEVLEIHRQWDATYGTPLLAGDAKFPAHTNDHSPNRKLRIGYVSQDFRSHVVTAFSQPVLANHSREQFEIFCYANVAKPDEITQQLRQYAAGWRDIFGKSDGDAEALVRGDKIDILIDLAGHTASNRLPLFARRPAPVQVSMIGYPCTTGLSAMDYKVTDPRCDPAGAERFYAEKLIRLPDVLWCYRPADNQPAICELPASRNGFITFGSVNKVAKITENALELWSRILRGVPRSRLRMQASGMQSQAARERITSSLRRHGIDENRVTLLAPTPSAQYVELIRSFDIALDTFPFNGGTTTCHLFNHGVPIVALAGERQVSRMGVSMLHAVGLPQLVAQSGDEYVGKTIELAKDIQSLAEIRATLRDRLLASPLCDGKRYTRNLESALRTIWSDWCTRS